jgi:hypothetical protein
MVENFRKTSRSASLVVGVVRPLNSVERVNSAWKFDTSLGDLRRVFVQPESMMGILRKDDSRRRLGLFPVISAFLSAKSDYTRRKGVMPVTTELHQYKVAFYWQQ